jgi:hypothetical protein
LGRDGAIDPQATLGHRIPAELSAKTVRGTDYRLVNQQHRAVPHDFPVKTIDQIRCARPTQE